MSEKYERLKALLKELFQLDQPDLDFGFYRVMHAKANEVTRFLDEDLLPQITDAFALYRTADKASLEAELAIAIEKAGELGADPDSLPKVKELRSRIANEAVDVGALEEEVYDLLFGFFRRYYSEGDFLAKRVYKPGVYAIPYEGEELTFHWANRDQYYIKTSEYLTDYAFSLRPHDNNEPKRVHLRLVAAAEGEHGNVKPAEGTARVFIPAEKDLLEEKAGELTISFEYRPATLADWPDDMRVGKSKPPAQKDLIGLTTERVLGEEDVSLASWINELAKPHVKASGEKASYSRLEAHLNRYAARNTFDYFIHKDLDGFLRRELDFYLQNEVMHLDDIEHEAAPRVEQYLSKLKVVRQIASKIIDFLAQLEEFQQKLWLKKKFVVETSYFITLDRIPESFYDVIAASETQREEWVKLFAIDEIEVNGDEPQYSVPLSVDFLKAHDKLPVDTMLFPVDFVERLVDELGDCDQGIDGMLVQSDNFHALRLIESRYREQVKCVYIDPPYNTDSSSIPYKNNYRHSSWLTMMNDRLEGLRRLMSRDSAAFVSIDKTERNPLQFVMDAVFGASNRVEELIWSMNTNNSQVPNYSTNHEYVLVYAKDRPTADQDSAMFREPKPGFEEVMAVVSELSPSYPSIAMIEDELRTLYGNHKLEYREEIEAQGLEWGDEKGNDPWKGLYNYSRAEYRDSNGSLVSEELAREAEARIWVWRESDASMPATKQAASTRNPEHKNWRFYEPLHPETGKPCPHPKSGWKFAYADDEESPDRRSFLSLDRDSRIAWGSDEKKIPQIKRMLHEVETNVAKSVFVDYSDGEKETSRMFGRSGIFLAPKHSSFVTRFLRHATSPDSVIVDTFGGSGSTPHAVIALNREDGGTRKYIVVEVADYFDTVLKPRVLKAAYSSDWRSGKPLSRQGSSQWIKILRLESYEDTLNNLELRRSDPQQSLLDDAEAQGADGLKEEYLLRYMLDVEARGSQSLLRTEAFQDPSSYKLRVKRPGGGESREVDVDLLETFNWLTGMTVQHISAKQHFVAEFERDGEKRLKIKSPLERQESGPRWFRTVTGTAGDGHRVLVIWRGLTGDSEEDNLVLDEWFKGQGYASKNPEFDLIYVNGDSNLENLKAPDDTWKVRLIEDDFHRLMFSAERI
jgi:adenine-specific DNA-methyltransferase